jgi:hypothetical protein
MVAERGRRHGRAAGGTQAKDLGCSLRTAHRVSAHHVSVKEKQGISQGETGSDLHTRVLAKHGLVRQRHFVMGRGR